MRTTPNCLIDFTSVEGPASKAAFVCITRDGTAAKIALQISRNVSDKVEAVYLNPGDFDLDVEQVADRIEGVALRVVLVKDETDYEVIRSIGESGYKLGDRVRVLV